MRISLVFLCLFCLAAAAAGRGGKPAAVPCNCTVTLLPAPLDSAGTDKSPLSVKVTGLPGKAPPKVIQDQEDRDEKVLTDRWTIGLASITAAILLLQLCVFGYQARELNNSIREAKRATEATLIAARAAEQTVITINLTARRDLRAYVAVLMSSIEKLDDEGTPRASVIIKNFGKTPAYGFAPSAELDYMQAGKAPADPPEATRQLGHLAPGGEFKIVVGADWKLSRAMRANVVAGLAAVYAHGIIKYVDTYGVPRFTRFRMVTNGIESVPSGPLISCPDWNGTDDDTEVFAAAIRDTVPIPVAGTGQSFDHDPPA